MGLGVLVPDLQLSSFVPACLDTPGNVALHQQHDMLSPDVATGLCTSRQSRRELLENCHVTSKNYFTV